MNREIERGRQFKDHVELLFEENNYQELSEWMGNPLRQFFFYDYDDDSDEYFTERPIPWGQTIIGKRFFGDQTIHKRFWSLIHEGKITEAFMEFVKFCRQQYHKINSFKINAAIRENFLTHKVYRINSDRYEEEMFPGGLYICLLGENHEQVDHMLTHVSLIQYKDEFKKRNGQKTEMFLECDAYLKRFSNECYDKEECRCVDIRLNYTGVTVANHQDWLNFIEITTLLNEIMIQDPKSRTFENIDYIRNALINHFNLRDDSIMESVNYVVKKNSESDNDLLSDEIYVRTVFELFLRLIDKDNFKELLNEHVLFKSELQQNESLFNNLDIIRDMFGNTPIAMNGFFEYLKKLVKMPSETLRQKQRLRLVCEDLILYFQDMITLLQVFRTLRLKKKNIVVEYGDFHIQKSFLPVMEYLQGLNVLTEIPIVTYHNDVEKNHLFEIKDSLQHIKSIEDKNEHDVNRQKLQQSNKRTRQEMLECYNDNKFRRCHRVDTQQLWELRHAQDGTEWFNPIGQVIKEERLDDDVPFGLRFGKDSLKKKPSSNKKSYSRSKVSTKRKASPPLSFRI